jgi:phosphoribosylamine--glycine ligase
MGAYAPAPVITDELKKKIFAEILQPTVDAMKQEDCLYRGCLYAGLIITTEGPKVIEFNARFGDPETQAVLPLLETDLLSIMEACSEGKLNEITVAWKKQAAVCVVLSAEGYPGSYRKGDEISGLSSAEQLAMVFHSGTTAQKDHFLTAGGRVMGVTAVAPTIKEAVDKVYTSLQQIHFDGMHYRRDIAHRALERN